MKLTQPVKGILSYDGIINQKYNDPNTPADLLVFYKSLGLKGHNGIDFGGVRGTNIYAAHDGLVISARNWGDVSGNTITLLGIKENGVYVATVYCHNDSLLVSEGQSVPQGQIIAKMGNSGSSAKFYMGVHLHFGLYNYTDPQPGTYQLGYPGGKTFTRLFNDNGFGGAIDPLPFLLNENMEYIIIGKEQYLLYAPLKMALNIGDQNILVGLVLSGLAGSPTAKTELPAGYRVYPLVDKETLKDIFGF